MKARRRSGRERRHQVAAAPPAVNPAPPGQRGGFYKPLSETECHKIYRAALDLLADLGMGEVPKRLADILIKNGAQKIDNERICIPAKMVEAARKTALSTFVFHGRDPKRSITVGGDRVHFGTGGAAVQVLDIDSGLYRAATLRDLHDFTRLQDALTNVSWFTRCCIATDIEDIYDLDANTLYALLCNTTRPVGTAFTSADHVAPLVDMLDIAAGGPGAFAERPWLKAHISPVISPMRFGEDA
ncbi:MAG: trimethylamine methyltransferase family protein, partial [Pseudomonadota bacterium]